MIVLDASVLVKWFLQEADSEIALRFKEDLLAGKEDIALPDLALYEVLNVLRFKPRVTEKALKSILPTLFELGLEIIAPSQTLLREALHLSFVTELSIYDCIYLALANELGVRLVTADKRIVRQAEPLSKVKFLIL